MINPYDFLIASRMLIVMLLLTFSISAYACSFSVFLYSLSSQKIFQSTFYGSDGFLDGVLFGMGPWGGKLQLVDFFLDLEAPVVVT